MHSSKKVSTSLRDKIMLGLLFVGVAGALWLRLDQARVANELQNRTYHIIEVPQGNLVKKFVSQSKPSIWNDYKFKDVRTNEDIELGSLEGVIMRDSIVPKPEVE